MSGLTRSLLTARHFLSIQTIFQAGRNFSLHLRHEDAKNVVLPFTNASYTFPPSPQTHIEPDQTGPVQTSFLEEATEEYGHLETANANDSTNHVERSLEAQATEVILRMIAKGDMDGALVARNELVRLGVGISQNRAFVAVAIAALSNPDIGIRSRNFIAWWSLVPLRECPSDVGFACSKLSTPKHLFNIPLLMDFTLLCAKAGYAPLLEKSKLFPHIIRYGDPNATSAFLLKLEHEAEKHYRCRSTTEWVSMRNLAIRMHLLAGRPQIAKDLFEQTVSKGITIEPKTMEHIRAHPTSTGNHLLPHLLIETQHRANADLARELRALRRIVASDGQIPHFAFLLSKFIYKYAFISGRSRAILMLRKKVFKDGSLATRARWVAGEQRAYDVRKMPIAVLRTHVNYCLADDLLEREARRGLKRWEGRESSFKRVRDYELSQKTVEVGEKVWPNSLGISLAWKAIIILSRPWYLKPLYTLFLNQAELAMDGPRQLASDLLSASDLKVADEHYYHKSSHLVSVPQAAFPSALIFHHFVVGFATRHDPTQGTQILRDMERLGLEPLVNTWGALAGAYARSGDFGRVLRLLDHFDGADATEPVQNERVEESEDSSRNAEKPSGRGKRRSLRTLRRTYNSVLRGFMDAGMHQEARDILWRMEQCGHLHVVEERNLRRLKRLERMGKERRRGRSIQQSVVVGDREIFVHRRRVQWL